MDGLTDHDNVSYSCIEGCTVMKWNNNALMLLTLSLLEAKNCNTVVMAVVAAVVIVTVVVVAAEATVVVVVVLIIC